MNKTLKKAIVTSASAVVACATIAPASVIAWGDSDGNSRPSYTIEQINDGVLGDKIVMNSISNSIAGDEKNFVVARQLDGKTADVDAIWSANTITVEDGKDYIVSMYVHNNNPKGREAVATGVTTTFSIDQESAPELGIQGQIDTDNASPKSYWDSVIFKSTDGSNFHLEYYTGSALLENNGIGKNGGIKLDDNLVASGVKIGYDALDGNIPGCFEYASYVSIKVKAVYDTDYTVSKEVRMAGTKDKFGESVNAKVGDKVEFQITYKNISEGQQNDVTIVDKMPTNLKYIEGTTKLYNGQVSGLTAEDTLTTEGIAIGSYAAHSSAVIRYTAEVIDNDLGCGDNELNNWAQVSINGNKVIDDNAIVHVEKTGKVCEEPDEPKTCDTNPEMPECQKPKTCETNPEMPECQPKDEPKEIVKTGADIIGTVLGAGSLTTALGYYISSRKNLKRF